jgi:hypothetical protein
MLFLSVTPNVANDVNIYLSQSAKNRLTTTDWTGTRYIGFTLACDHYAKNQNFNLTMPGYISRALKHFEHPKTASPPNALHAWTPPVYGRGMTTTCCS